MIRLTTVFVRPNTSIPFWKFDADTKAHVQATYPAVEATLTDNNSADGLTKTVTRDFADEAAVAAWMADTVIIAAKAGRDAYCSSNNIAFTADSATI